MEQSITINSGLVTNGVDGQLIQLVKILQIENQCSFEDALETGRQFVCKKQIEFMTDSDIKNVKNIVAITKQKLKDSPNNEYLNSIYKLLKYMKLNTL